MGAGGAMNEIWYYAEGDETRGPIAFDQLIRILSQLPTPKGVLVWREGFKDWTAAENVREIIEKLIRPPPLRPRSPAAAPAETAVDDTIARYKSQDTPANAEPAGIGGWLGLLAFGLVAGTLKSVVKAGQLWSSADMSTAFRKFPAFANGALMLDLGYLLLFILAIGLFFNKSRKFPPLFIFALITSIVIPLLVVVWAILTLPSSFEIAQLFGHEEIAQIVVGLIGAALWIPYILKSKRVANTFVN
jgi:hypothetical protein